MTRTSYINIKNTLNTQPNKTVSVRHFFIHIKNVPASSVGDLSNSVKNTIMVYLKKKDGRRKTPTILQRFLPLHTTSELFIFVNVARLTTNLDKTVLRGLSMKPGGLYRFITPTLESSSFIEQGNVNIFLCCEFKEFCNILVTLLKLKAQPVFIEFFSKRTEAFFGQPIDISNFDVCKLLTVQTIENLMEMFPENFQMFYGILTNIYVKCSCINDLKANLKIVLGLETETDAEELSTSEVECLYQKALNLITHSSISTNNVNVSNRLLPPNTFIWKRVSYNQTKVLDDLKNIFQIYIETPQNPKLYSFFLGDNPRPLETFKQDSPQGRRRIVQIRLNDRKSAFLKKMKQTMQNQESPKDNEGRLINGISDQLLDGMHYFDAIDFYLTAKEEDTSLLNMEQKTQSLILTPFAFDENLFEEFSMSVLDGKDKEFLKRLVF